jgi:hypothetical protein
MGKQDAVTDGAPTEDAIAERANPLDYRLVVRHAFGNYRKGDAITDAGEIAAVLAGESAGSVHKVIE